MLPFSIYLILEDLMPLLRIYESFESYKKIKIHLRCVARFGVISTILKT